MQRTFRYVTAFGKVAVVVASKIYFEPAHVVFRDDQGAIVLAEENANVRLLAEDDVAGSSARRPPPST